MDIGMGLPAHIPDVEGKVLVDWAVRAEQAGFSTLGTLGRLVYPNYDDLIALAAAAAVTKQIRLTTSVLLAPLHANVALLAKQAASLDRLSGGRLVLGLGIGGRDDDFTASGLPTTGRGRRLAAQIEEMRRIWGGEKRGAAGPIGPPPVRESGPELILGAINPASFRRVAGMVDGWIMGGGTPEMFAQLGSAIDQAWQDAGRPGKPRKLSLAYFALGPGASEEADASIKSYYAWLGHDVAGQIAAGAAVSAEMVKAYVTGFEHSGCDELIFVPGSSRPDQVTLLAEAIA
jgi:alkanesulfonate monooxygenase SsuD/methylene tetrahydromethanopterin reductase-like flavin-dependent oxidoreductase (luciferase family)